MKIPTHFSGHTMKCVKDGVLTSRARAEIVEALSTIIMLHTLNPSPEHYNTCCKRLVETHPTLKDIAGDTDYVRLKKYLYT